jgi:hypothetical protein
MGGKVRDLSSINPKVLRISDLRKVIYQSYIHVGLYPVFNFLQLDHQLRVLRFGQPSGNFRTVLFNDSGPISDQIRNIHFRWIAKIERNMQRD